MIAHKNSYKSRFDYGGDLRYRSGQRGIAITKEGLA
jgi:hypothetical protein